MPQSDAGHAVDLGKGAQNHHVALALPDVLEGIRVFVGSDEFVIGLVKDDQDVIGHFLHKGVHLGCRDDCPGGVVGIADKDDLGSVVDRPRHRFHVQAIVLQRRLDERGPHSLGEHVIDGKGGMTDDDLAIFIQIGHTGLQNDAVRAVPHDQLLWLDLEPLRKCAAQVVALRVRVAIQPG